MHVVFEVSTRRVESIQAAAARACPDNASGIHIYGHYAIIGEAVWVSGNMSVMHSIARGEVHMRQAAAVGADPQ